MPRNVAESWRDTPRAMVKQHKINSTPDNKTAFIRNLLNVNAGLDFVSAHMGGVDDRAGRPWVAAAAANPATPPAAVLLETARIAAAGGAGGDSIESDERGERVGRSGSAVTVRAPAATHAGREGARVLSPQQQQQPLYLGEYTATINSTTGRRSYAYAEAVLSWQLGLDARLGRGGGVLTSLWVFEYAPQNETWSLEPGRDDELLSKITTANRILQRYQTHSTG